MEFLFIQLELAVEAGEIHPIRKANQSYVSHLLFADDLLIFTKADELKYLEKILMNLKLNTGLAVNKDKSRIFLAEFSSANPTLYLGEELKVIISIPEGALHQIPWYSFSIN